MDTDLINWVGGVCLRFLGSLLTFPEFGWSFQRLCSLMISHARMMCSGAVSYELIPIERLAGGSKLLSGFCDKETSMEHLASIDFDTFLIFKMEIGPLKLPVLDFPSLISSTPNHKAESRVSCAKFPLF